MYKFSAFLLLQAATLFAMHVLAVLQSVCLAISMPVLFYKSVKLFFIVWIQDEENAGNVKRQLAKIFEVSLKTTVPDEIDVEPLIAACTGNFGDYQWLVNFFPFQHLFI